jgi:2-keto-3-deoxy-L-fuconate dehydrogenase
MTSFNLTGKVAIITGGSSGIGKAIAEQFISAGAEVAVIDLQTGRGKSYTCDVTHQADVIATFKKISDEIGPVDILVNSAGIANIARLDTTSEAEFDKVFQVNVKGTYNSMLAAIMTMKQRQKGVILNLASVAAHVGIPERFAYSMSKGAIVSMTLSVARDYIKDGIRCNCISPARVHTPFVDGFIQKNYPGQEKEMFDKLSKTQPIGRMASPKEIASLALYLCSDEASFITGTDYPIDGGFITLNN